MEERREVGNGPHQEEIDEEELLVKRKIACHPMFALLKQTHLSCLQACMGKVTLGDSSHQDFASSKTREKEEEPTTDLDLFMEAYYMALVELKRAIEEPMQEASAFVGFVHQLLEEGDVRVGSYEEGQPELMGGYGEAVCEEMGKLGIRE